MFYMTERYWNAYIFAPPLGARRRTVGAEADGCMYVRGARMRFVIGGEKPEYRVCAGAGEFNAARELEGCRALVVRRARGVRCRFTCITLR